MNTMKEIACDIFQATPNYVKFAIPMLAVLGFGLCKLAAILPH